jgi:hypothetical protein
MNTPISGSEKSNFSECKFSAEEQLKKHKRRRNSQEGHNEIRIIPNEGLSTTKTKKRVKLCLKNTQIVKSRQFNNSSCPHGKKTNDEDIYINLRSNEITSMTSKERKNLMVKNMRHQS